MTAAVRPLWRGRAVVLLGIVLVSMSLRTVLAGLIHEATGSWTVPLIVLAASSLLIMAAAVVLRSGHFVEDAFPAREPATD